MAYTQTQLETLETALARGEKMVRYEDKLVEYRARAVLSKLGFPIHEAAGRGRRSVAWSPGNPGGIAAMLETHNELVTKSRGSISAAAFICP